MKNILKRHYAVIDSTNGLLIGSMTWDNVSGIYASDPNSVRAIYRLKRTGRLQIKWVCTGLDATAQENRDEIDRLNKLRGQSGALTTLGALGL